jgi:Domain of unknown function (DUF929)
MTKRKAPSRCGPTTSTTATSTTSTMAQRRLTAQRAAAARARIDQACARRRLLLVGGSVIAIVAVVAVLIVAKLATHASGLQTGTPASVAPAAVLEKVRSVPIESLNAVGTGGVQTLPVRIEAPVLSTNGKHELLYVGAEYCPYCAAERWAVAVALSRFGTLRGVGETASSPSDVYPDTATLTFHNATYTSSFVAFVPKELQSNQLVNGQYGPLDSLSATQQGLVSKYNAPPYTATTGSIPFLDIGGMYVVSGASYSPQVLQGDTQVQIAAALRDPASSIARDIDGTANLLTAAICATTGMQPTAVCSSAGVQTATSAMQAAAG